MSKQKTSDFAIGASHRVVIVDNIEEYNEEKVAEFMLRKCGQFEDWRVDEPKELDDGTRLVSIRILFENLTSISTALALNGIPFEDRSLIIWQGNRLEKPVEAMKLITSGKDMASVGSVTTEKEQEEKMKNVKEMLKRMNEKHLVSKQSGNAQCNTADPSLEVAGLLDGGEGNERKLRAFYLMHALRQGKALSIITRHMLRFKKGELKGLQTEYRGLCTQCLVEGDPYLLNDDCSEYDELALKAQTETTSSAGGALQSRPTQWETVAPQVSDVSSCGPNPREYTSAMRGVTLMPPKQIAIRNKADERSKFKGYKRPRTDDSSCDRLSSTDSNITDDSTTCSDSASSSSRQSFSEPEDDSSRSSRAV